MITVMLDVDGVLLDWDTGLKQYYHDLGYTIPTLWWNRLVHREEYYSTLGVSRERHHQIVEAFCRSLHIGQLQPNRDAVVGVKMLREKGVRMIVCTMLGSHPLQQKARIENLERVFGPVFEAYHFVDYRDLELHGSSGNFETKASLMKRHYGSAIDCVVDDSATIMDQFADNYPSATRVLFHNKHDLRGERECNKDMIITSLKDLPV